LFSPAKTNAEAKLAEGVSSTITTATDLGVQGTTGRCDMKVTVAKSGLSTIQCKLKGTSSIDTKVIQWTRTADDATTGAIGTWTCKTNVAGDFMPKTCSGGASAI